MKKRALTLLLLLVVFVFSAVLAGCDMLLARAPTQKPKPTPQQPTEHYHEIDTSAWQSNDTYHWRKCKTCSMDISSTQAEHTFELAVNDQDEIVNKCTVCGYEVAHTCVADTTQLYSDGEYHWYKCSICAEDMEKVPHSFSFQSVVGGQDYSVCTVCNKEKLSAHTHQPQWQTTATTHVKICSVCLEDISAEEDHEFTFVYDSETDTEHYHCSVCGYDTTPFQHVCSYGSTWTSDVNGHSKDCLVCGKTMTQDHEYQTLYDTDGSQYRKCSICNYINKEVVQSDHLFINLNIINGQPSTKTYELPLDSNVGEIQSITCGEIDFGASKNISLSKVGLKYGDETIVVTTSKTIIKIPVTFVTAEIKSLYNLNAMMNWAFKNGGSVAYRYDGYYLLSDDIDATGFNATVIPNANLADADGFVGVFDGNGHTISNLSMTSTDANSAFISKLGATGVIKNVAFTNAKVGSSSLICSAGSGTVKDVYVQYAVFGANSTGAGSNGALTNMATTFTNNSVESLRKVKVQNCIIDLTQETFYTKRKTALSAGNGCVLARYPAGETQFSDVMIVGTTDCTNITYFWSGNERTSIALRQSTYGGSFYSYDDTDSFVTQQGYAVGNWGELWAFDGSNVKFNGQTILTGNVSTQSGGTTFISNDKTHTDYVLVYDRNDPLTLEAASLIAKHIKHATADVTYGCDEQTTLYANIDYYRLSGGVDMAKTSSVLYNPSACYIVVGNKDVATQAGLTLPDHNNYVIKKVDNSVFILADDSCDYLAAAIEFLEKSIGYKVLANDQIVFEGDLPQTLTFETVDDELPFDLRSESATFDWYSKLDLGYNGSTFLAGQGRTWHNTFDWLPLEEFKETHPKWYSKADPNETDTWGHPYNDDTQLCYTAQGDATEYNALVAELAQRITQFLLNNPSVTNVSFTQQDTTNWCKCSKCKAEYTRYGNSNSGVIVALLNDVVEYMDSHFATKLQDRDYKIYFFAYHATEMAPTGIKANPKVNVILAPIEASYCDSVYSSVNDKYRNNMLKWATICDNLAVWLYEVVYYNAIMPFNSFESTLTWFEFCANSLEVEWIFSEGLMTNRYASNFSAFKAYIDSHAEREIKKYVNPHNSYASEEAYNTAIRNYLTKLENEFFATNGYYGKAGPKMRELYNLERADCTSAALKAREDCAIEGRTYKNSEMHSTILRTANTYSSAPWVSSLAATEYRVGSGMCWRYWTKNQINAYLVKIGEAFDLLDRTDPMYYLHYRHVLQETMGPRFMALTAWFGAYDMRCDIKNANKTKIRTDTFKVSDYDCSGLSYTYRDYDGTKHTVTGNDSRQQFVVDCGTLHLDRYGEDPNTCFYGPNGSYAGLFPKWQGEGSIAAYTIPAWSAYQAK